MAITANDIHNQSFSIDRKGYDVDEVDVFLEHVADEIDDMNQTIDVLRDQLQRAESQRGMAPAAPSLMPSDMSSDLARKDARIIELESQLEAKKADDNAIAQALIIAQRSADEILANANARANDIVADAEDEAKRIVDKAEGERTKVLDAIKKLEDDRESARESYKDLLTDFIGDATRKLAEIGEVVPQPKSFGTHSTAGRTSSKPAAQAPINATATPAYSTPQATDAVVVAATPVPATVEKDLSGFGDAEAVFEFDELD
uniref:DivIVA domain-containing protein n=1 Tax=Muribaculaceae bacterium Z82 TaxID=2304548 RepID=A0A7C9JE89_9BACT